MSSSDFDLCPVECATCPVGLASGIDRGQFCPWVSREYAAGEILAEADEPADYIWFVKDGVVGLREPGSERVSSVRPPGTFVGLECLNRDRRTTTAEVIVPAILCGAPREAFITWLGNNAERVGLILDAAERDSSVVLESDRG